MRRLFPLLLLLVVVQADTFAQRRRRMPLPPPPPPAAVVEKPETFGLTVEKYISSYSINADGTGTQALEIQMKCALERCMSQVKEVAHVFNAELEDVKLLGAHIIKKDGKKLDVSKDNGKTPLTPQGESAPDFSSLKQIEIVFAGIEVNETANYKIEVLTKKPIFGRHYDSLDLFPSLYEWKNIEINVSSPENLPLHFEATGLKGGEVKSPAGRKLWQWKASDLAAISFEVAMVDTQSKSPRFAVSTFASFEELGSAFGSAFREKVVVTSEVRTLAEDITKGIAEPRAQARAIYAWVNKNIRYLLVVLDRGGWIPHSTEQILNNRYGDCKDYTALIYALLKAKGIESVPVLINAQFGNWFPKVVATGHFDHAILYIPSLDVYADATSPNTRIGQIPQTLVGKTAVQAGEKPGLVHLPKDRPDDNQVLSDTDIEILADGTLKATVNNTFKGRSEMAFRPLFSDVQRSGKSDQLVQIMLSMYGLAGSGRIVEISDLSTTGEPFSMKMEVEIPDFTTIIPKGTIMIPPGVNTIGVSTLEAFVKAPTRVTDLHMGASRISEKFRITVPEKVVLGELPPPTKFSNSSGTFEISFAKTERGFEMTKEIVIAKDMFFPTEYAAIKELIAKTSDSGTPLLPYTSDGSFLKAKSKQIKSRRAAGVEEIVGDMLGLNSSKLTAADAKRLEARVKLKPTDEEARRQLVSYYNDYTRKATVADGKKLLSHRLWFVQNRPQKADYSIIGFFFDDKDDPSPEYISLREEWKKQLLRLPNDQVVRMNAFNFVSSVEPELGESILEDGLKAAPETYEFLAALSTHLAENLEDSDTDAKQTRARILDLGKKALVQLKTDRSDHRNTSRRNLLEALCPVAVKDLEFSLAESFARELILDFASDIDHGSYQDAAHIGNITLGEAALARGDVKKAGEYLMIAIKAPLRKKDGYFYKPDTDLAKKLFEKGEKAVVVEYLTALLLLPYMADDEESGEPEDDAVAVKKWLSEIGKGTVPTFDLNKP